MAAYCEVDDLLTGDIPTPAYLDVPGMVQDAADEIDSKIGHLYDTPIDVTDSGAAARWVKLLLKRLNVFLATGRLLMAAAAGGEDDRVHAYGSYLIREATAALNKIVSGEITLEGVTGPANEAVVSDASIILLNLDPESHVEAFYGRLMTPPAFPYAPLETESERVAKW